MNDNMNDNIRKMLLERAHERNKSNFLITVSSETHEVYETIWQLLLEKFDEERYKNPSDDNYTISHKFFFLTSHEYMNNDRFNGHAWNGLDSEPGRADTFNTNHKADQIIFIFPEDSTKNRKMVFEKVLLKLLEEDGISVTMNAKTYEFVFGIKRKSLEEKIDDEYVSSYTKRFNQ